MLKKRLIPALFIKDGLIVRSENFQKFKVIGNVVNEVRRYNQWDIDELLYIDISRGNYFDSGRSDHKVERVTSMAEVLSLVSRECFMPVTFGGRLDSFDSIAEFLRNGADKVIVNTLAFTNPEAVREASRVFGKQAIVFSCDYRMIDNSIVFFSHQGTVEQARDFTAILDVISHIECGEVLLHDIGRDGEANGYNLEAISTLAPLLDVPVVVCGGAGDKMDFDDVAGIPEVSGIAAGNWFHFTEQSYPRAKTYLKRKGHVFR